jgi:hypothetical protein
MDIINESIDIKKMYKTQISDLESEDYKKYLKNLVLYFSKEHKKDKYLKDYIDGKYILIDKNNPKKKIEITPSQFINIHSMYINLKEETELILFKINNLIETKNNITEENRKDFDNLKQKYINYKEKLNEIDDINKEYYTEMEILLRKKIDKSNELIKYYQNRNKSYSDITVLIKEDLKNKLIKYFKENKKRIPSLTIINKIAKDNTIPSNEIEKWFIWIENVYYYILIQKELNNMESDIIDKEENFDINTKYMIIKKPNIEE